MKRKAKPLTPERIEREYRVSVCVAWAFRTVGVIFGIGVAVLLILGLLPLWGLIYLLFPPLWWWTATLWLSAAKDMRRTGYSIIEARKTLDELRRAWSL